MAQTRSGAKGYDMEETLRSYFLRAGYFVARGVPYRLDGEDISDIDLWLYERPAAATRRRLIVDIKNKRSPKAAERIIWVKGLQAALGVDGAIVATTDRRPATRRLAKTLGVALFDGDAIEKLTKADKSRGSNVLTSTEFDEAVRQVDLARRTTEWRQTLQETRSSLIVGMGVQSANKSLSSQGFFAQQAILAQPGSTQAETATRVAYLMSALAAISLDFTLADHAFRSPDDRRAALINSIRFGQSEAVPAMATVRAAISLARKYAEGGISVAKQIEYGFRTEAEEIPAEIIADLILRLSGSDAIFSIARELETASSERSLKSFDELSTEAKSALGAFLDFNGVPREKFASAWKRNPASVSEAQTPGPLFNESVASPKGGEQKSSDGS